MQDRIFCLRVLNQSERLWTQKKFPVRYNPKDNFPEWKSALTVASNILLEINKDFRDQNLPGYPASPTHINSPLNDPQAKHFRLQIKKARRTLSRLKKREHKVDQENDQPWTTVAR